MVVTLGGEGAVSEFCTCPYDYGGWRKHVIAVLLTYLKKPMQVRERLSLEEMLAQKSQAQLHEVLEHLLRHHPKTIETLETYLADQN